jgi:hypothetical protein
LAPLKSLGFVLYGGTAVALRFGHRQSVDFDFFSDRPWDEKALRAGLPFLSRSQVLDQPLDTLTILTPVGDEGGGHVKVSFFGGICFGRVGDPSVTSDGTLWVASAMDLLALKLAVILKRAEMKDYLDIAALLRSGLALEAGLSATSALYGGEFQPSAALRALVYFEDGDIASLPVKDKEFLIRAAGAVRDLPSPPPLTRSLMPL